MQMIYKPTAKSVLIYVYVERYHYVTSDIQKSLNNWLLHVTSSSYLFQYHSDFFLMHTYT